MHITLRSSKAKGTLSMLAPRHRAWIKDYAPLLARRLGIRLHHFSNNGGHLHLVTKTKERRAFDSFLRSLSGVIARRMLGAQKGNPKDISFWDSRPYSRILSWGREFRNVMEYLERNALEALRKIPYRARDLVLESKYRQHVSQSLSRNRFARESWSLGQGLLF